MIVHRSLAAAGAAALAAAVALLPAAPAAAHGATSDPASRAFFCSPETGLPETDSEACRAAVAANDGREFVQWDNIRIAMQAGQERQIVADGNLCSMGLPAYKGLDLPSADWPTTTLTPGAEHRFVFGQKIPHPGNFRVYVTNETYDPTVPLSWSMIEEEPFHTAVNPPLAGDHYEFTAALPTHRLGRQLLLVVWETVPDTYLSCSDVVFEDPAGGEDGEGEGEEPGQDGATEATLSGEAGGNTPAGLAAKADAATGNTTSTTPVSAASSTWPAAVALAVGTTSVAALGGLFLWRRGRRHSA